MDGKQADAMQRLLDAFARLASVQNRAADIDDVNAAFYVAEVVAETVLGDDRDEQALADGYKAFRSGEVRRLFSSLDVTEVRAFAAALDEGWLRRSAKVITDNKATAEALVVLDVFRVEAIREQNG